MDDGFLTVWSHLVAAYWKQGSHGDAAEIYAYHLTPFCPTMMLSTLKEDAQLDAGSIAHRRMMELCLAFERVMDCRLEFDPSHWSGDKGLSLEEWGLEGHPFTYRVLVKVCQDTESPVFSPASQSKPDFFPLCTNLKSALHKLFHL